MIVATVTGDRAVALELRSMDIRVRGALRRAVTRESLLLLAYVKAGKLSGQVLKTRTGTLRRSINRQQTETPTSIEATVGTNVSYARIHEYGFDGTESVRAHVRTITSAFGRPLASAVQQQVGAHQRRVHMPERSFLRSALADRTPDIIAAFEKAVAGAVK